MSANRMVASRRLEVTSDIASRSGRGDTLRRRPRRQTRDILVEHLLTLEAGRAEHHGPANLRAEVDIRGAELLAQEIGTLSECPRKRRHDVLIAAPADGRFTFDGGPLHHLVRERGLHAARAEEKPTIVGAA